MSLSAQPSTHKDPPRSHHVDDLVSSDDDFGHIPDHLPPGQPMRVPVPTADGGTKMVCSWNLPEARSHHTPPRKRNLPLNKKGTGTGRKSVEEKGARTARRSIEEGKLSIRPRKTPGKIAKAPCTGKSSVNEEALAAARTDNNSFADINEAVTTPLDDRARLRLRRTLRTSSASSLYPIHFATNLFVSAIDLGTSKKSFG